MAEDQKGKEKELSSDETAELEALLDTAGSDGAAESAASGPKGKLQQILSNKKLLMLFGGGALVLLIVIGAGVYFTMSGTEEVVPVEEEEAEKEVKEEETSVIEKVNIYKLEPFFLPVRENGKETGRFLSLSANLLLSNSVLNKDLNKVLPLVRKNIYGILRRKRPSDFTLKRANTEERIKREIRTATNALLLSGTGTVTDVFFSSFMVK
ncbi:flagellar basal body-associated FliL family protein [Nitrospinaceae bacterium]|nr:flagellar basal body-associated FliL family protein [Nitrospinaceae bacterium]